MDADKKLGFALGILLCGIVGAFFFRDEAEPADKQPQLANAAKLDDQIRQRPQTPYLPNAEATDIERVPEALASDVMPNVPGDRSSNDAQVIPEPIRPSDSDNADIDRVAPIPSPSSDGQLDAAFTRANLDSNTATNPGTNAQRPRLSQNAPVSLDPQALGANTTNASSSNSNNKPAETKTITHEVVVGDTLSQIATKYLGTQRRMNELYEFNKHVLKSPDDLQLGMKLKIPTGQSTAAPTKPEVKPAAAAASASTPIQTPAAATTPVSRTTPAAAATIPATTPTPAANALSPAATPIVTPARTGELFVRPPRSPLSPVPRTSQAPGGSLSQTPPPGVPVVDGLLGPPVIATRPKPDEAPVTKNE